MVKQAIKKGTGIQKKGLNAWKEKTGMVIDKPKEDEQAVTIDLRDTLQVAGESPANGEKAGEPKWRNTPSADEVVIHIEDDEPTPDKPAEENNQRRWGGWLRR